MKKNIRLLVVILLIIGLLGGSLWVLQITEPVPAEASSEPSEVSESENYALVELGKENLDYVEVKNSNGEYVVKQTDLNEDDEYNYVFEGYENYTLTSSLISAIESISSLTAYKSIGSVENPKDYGFDSDETVYLTVVGDDGTNTDVQIGIEGAETYGNYVMVNDEVYIASVDSAIFTDMKENIDLYLYSEVIADTNGNTTTTLNEIRFTGKNFPEEVYVALSEEVADYFVVEPLNNMKADVYYIEQMAAEIGAFSADAAAVLNATEEDLETYGLTDPYVHIEFAINGGEHSITVSEISDDNGMRYVLIDDITDTIYTVEESRISQWVDSSINDLRHDTVFLPYLSDVAKVTMEINGETSVIDFIKTEVEGEEDKFTYTGTIDGKDVSYDDGLQPFYLTLISVAKYSMDKSEYNEEPTFKITYEYHDGREDSVLSYHETEDGRYLALLDGEFTAVVRSSSLDEVYTALDELKAMTAE